MRILDDNPALFPGGGPRRVHRFLFIDTMAVVRFGPEDRGQNRLTIFRISELRKNKNLEFRATRFLAARDPLGGGEQRVR